MVNDNDIRRWRNWCEKHGVDHDEIPIDRRMDPREMCIVLAKRIEELENDGQ